MRSSVSTGTQNSHGDQHHSSSQFSASFGQSELCIGPLQSGRFEQWYIPDGELAFSLVNLTMLTGGVFLQLGQIIKQAVHLLYDLVGLGRLFIVREVVGI